jgi:hypothetical protein
MADDQQRQGETGSDRPAATRATPPEPARQEPRRVTAIYRGPSDVLHHEGHVLRRHEPTEVPEDVLDRLAASERGHVVERVS